MTSLIVSFWVGWTVALVALWAVTHLLLWWERRKRTQLLDQAAHLDRWLWEERTNHHG